MTNFGRKLATTALAIVVATGVTVGVSQPAQAAGRCVDYQYAYGGYSTCIGYIQKLLNYFKPGPGAIKHVTLDSAHFVPLAIDNDFGPKTRAAVVSFQTYWGLIVDGIVGPQTWRWLCSPQKGPGPVPGFPYDAQSAAGCLTLWD